MWSGTILTVDLTKGKVTKEPTLAYTRFFLGGRGINAKILYDSVGPEVDPLSQGNVLVFGTGPFTGTLVPGSSRVDVGAKSPVTGLLGMANMGGYWGAELKYAGYDHLVITGKAPKPVYIAIDNDDVQIRDASAIWGLDTYQTPNAVRNEIGAPDAQVVCIGPGGENLVRYAILLTKVKDSAGRTGMGAVAGSKNLKAVVVRGTKGVRVANSDKFLEACLEAQAALKASPLYCDLSTTGSAAISSKMYKAGGMAVGNMQSAFWDRAEEVDQEAFWQKYGVKRTGCFGCPSRCMEQYDIQGKGALVVSCDPYYTFTFSVKNSDMMLFYEATRLCQRYGIDTKSISRLISWAMELYEKGIITKDDTDGIAMVWGSREAIIGMIEKVVKREGLADGVEAAITKIGRGSEQYMMHVKGLPYGIQDPRGDLARSLGTAMGTRGDHYRGMPVDPLTVVTDAEKRLYTSIYESALAKHGPDADKVPWQRSYDGKGAALALAQKLVAVTDMLLNCKWTTPWIGLPVGIERQAKLLSLGTGRAWSVDDLLEMGWRLLTLERAYNVREGLTYEQDTLPKRFFEEPLPDKWPEEIVDRDKFERARSEYYMAMGWDAETGIPTRETLEQRGLGEVADDLERREKLPKKAEV